MTRGMPIALSSQGMRNLVLSQSEQDFVFTIGSMTFGCPLSVGLFLSTRLAGQFLADPTIREFQITTKDAERIFPKILQLGRGSSVEIAESEKPIFIGVCAELQNPELFELIFGRIRAAPTIETVFDRLFVLLSQQSDITCEISFIASHFHEFSFSQMLSLDLSILNEILCNPSLRLESDDRLCLDILNQAELDGRYFSLLEFVRFEYLSPSVFTAFLNFVNASFEYFNYSIWLALQNHLEQSTKPKGKTFPFVADRPFQGIIAYLTERYGGNVHDHNRVRITSNRTRRDSYLPKNVADLESPEGFWSDNSIGQFLCYDFVYWKVWVTHYSIRSHESEDETHPRNWALEGSNDGSEWTLLDSRMDDEHLNGGNRVWSFRADSPTAFRQIRIRSTGPSHNPEYSFFGFVSFELFGTLCNDV
jgi:hypothetical protein